MDDIAKRATQWGIDTEFYDALGRLRVVEPDVLESVLDTFGANGEPPSRMLPQVVVVRQGRDGHLRLDVPADAKVKWRVSAESDIATGEVQAPTFALPSDLPIGAFRLRIDAASSAGERSEQATVLVAPERAFQGRDNDPPRVWAIAVQLYGIRSRRNWGHGDFTDLSNLLDLAAEIGAAGIGLNPLHALFDEWPEDCSPYSPNSRFFLNTMNIDVEAIPEFPGLATAGMETEIAALRTRDLIDYGGVGRAKARGLALAYDAFRLGASDERRQAFADFRRERGQLLERFAAFEFLRRTFGPPWWDWPPQWRKPDDAALDRLRASDGDAISLFAFVQWIADQQLGACRDKARRLGLPVGLYVDLAVGVRSDSFDAWNDQDFIVATIEVGAPPDLLNTAGQKWGLAGFNPINLVERGCEPFRQILRAAMRHAGAIRLDHVLGLKRLYVVPKGKGAAQGAYIRFPFDAMLAVAAQESVRNECLVIGEDLGTVPEGFRDTLTDWGLWSYHVMLFERAVDGGFIAPKYYREKALVTFATHDLPTFAGWASDSDLAVKRGLGLDPGETDAERAAAHAQMREALTGSGLRPLGYAAIVQFLAATPSRLLVVTLEDVLGIAEQVNIPGTTDEHPNWRRRSPVLLEDLNQHASLKGVAQVAERAGRRIQARM